MKRFENRIKDIDAAIKAAREKANIEWRYGKSMYKILSAMLRLNELEEQRKTLVREIRQSTRKAA